MVQDKPLSTIKMTTNSSQKNDVADQTLKAVGKAAKSAAKGTFSLPSVFTQDIKRSIRLFKESKDVLTKKDDREFAGAETFEQMMDRIGLTEEEFQSKLNICRVQAIVYGFAMSIIFLWTIWMWTLPGLFAGICSFVIAGMLWFRWSLRLWRLRIRDLRSHSDFLKTDWYLEWLK